MLMNYKSKLLDMFIIIILTVDNLLEHSNIYWRPFTIQYFIYEVNDTMRSSLGNVMRNPY